MKINGMKQILTLLSLLLLHAALYSQYKVTLIVTQTSSAYHDSIYVSGNFNKYSYKPDSKYLLSTTATNKKTISLEVKGTQQFIFHRGSDTTTATTAEGIALYNQKFTIQKDTVINFVIGGWKDKLPFIPVLTITDSIIKVNRGIPLGEMNCWYFKKGQQTPNFNSPADTIAWKKFLPKDVDKTLADNNNRREGWFKAYIKVDSSMMYNPIHFKFGIFGAGELYINGKLVQTYGRTGLGKEGYKEYTPNHRLPIQFTLDTTRVHEILLHIVDYLLPLENEKYSKGWLISIWDKEGSTEYAKHVEEEPFFNTLWLTVGALLCLLFWALSFQNREEKNLRLIAFTSTSLLVLSITVWMPHNAFASLFLMIIVNDYLPLLAMKSFYVFSILLVVNIFKRKVTRLLKSIIGLYILSSLFDYMNPELFFEPAIIYILIAIIFNGYYIISSWKSLNGAQWFIVGGVALTYLLVLSLVGIGIFRDEWMNSTSVGLMFTGIFLSLPISLLFYISFRFKEFVYEVQYNAAQVLQLSEEKKQQALEQQKILELEVARQTMELRSSIETLKTTQTQLIQSEKMASLGELTAGIAHEIQNPLNFVNNFAEVNTELIEEMKEELLAGKTDNAIELSNDIKANNEKITYHGKRADSIVKGMLQHSRNSNSHKELTNINTLLDECLRLSFHGMRAKDKSFNAKTDTMLDSSLTPISVVSQDIGRVLLNLFTNAFYSVIQKKKQLGAAYQPTVAATTLQEGNKVKIIIKDNGNGIPQKVMDKIFQPFFTTKPTGEGTGLGLSMSYEIITKGHNGELIVNTKEGEFAEFIITLPYNN